MKWLLLAAGLLAGGAQAAGMTVLRYVDQDPGDPPYTTRMLVTSDFMRMDDGADDGDFILLDRRQRRVINVMRGSKLAMVFTPAALPPRPAGWKPRLVTGKASRGRQRFSLDIHGVVCNEGVIAPKAAPEAVRAMAELKSILAATQYRVWKETPREMQHDCDLANQVWDAGAALKLGLPLEEREFSGRVRQFESVSRQPVQPTLFRVPEGLTTINAPS